MKKKAQQPLIPFASRETARRNLSSLIKDRTLSAKDLSVETGISEKDVYDHLAHIRRTSSQGDQQFVITPAACRRCNFVFRKRDKLKKPGKCPICKSESIREPLFSIKRRNASCR